MAGTADFRMKLALTFAGRIPTIMRSRSALPLTSLVGRPPACTLERTADFRQPPLKGPLPDRNGRSRTRGYRLHFFGTRISVAAAKRLTNTFTAHSKTTAWRPRYLATWGRSGLLPRTVATSFRWP